MPYDFHSVENFGSHKNYTRSITYLTRSDKNNASTGFCCGLSDISGIDFDAVKEDWCRIRNKTCPQDMFSSVDCFVKVDDAYYFIEFKKATSKSLSGIELYEGHSIDVSIRRKAFDSLAIAPMTVLQSVPGSDIIGHAEFIVVYVPDATESLSAIDIRNKIKKLAGCEDSLYRGFPVRWGVEELKSLKLFRDVHTWPANIFESWARDHLR